MSNNDSDDSDDSYDSDDNIDDYINKELLDVGIFGKAVGFLRSSFRYGDKDFVSLYEPTMTGKELKDKILKIDTRDAFDEFTERYGNVFKKGHPYIYISWDEIADKYKGFYLDEGLAAERFTEVIFNGEVYKSWWMSEYPYKEVIIFQPLPDIGPEGVKINIPFMGKIYGENDFMEDTYITIYQKPNIEKILKINKVEDFDETTSRYGYLTENKSNKKNNQKETIQMNWKKMSHDYKGFYIDKDSGIDIYKMRYTTAYYNDKKYNSWWRNQNISLGKVYVFMSTK